MYYAEPMRGLIFAMRNAKIVRCPVYSPLTMDVAGLVGEGSVHPATGHAASGSRPGPRDVQMSPGFAISFPLSSIANADTSANANIRHADPLAHARVCI